jgi:small membrane protein
VTVQILLVLAALGALVYFVRKQHNVRIRASKRIAFFMFIAANIYAVLRPDDITWIARHLGIGRGTDLVVYLLVVAFVFGMLNTYLRQREISDQLTHLARQLALQQAEQANRDRGLIAGPARRSGSSRAQSSESGDASSRD